ncbi:XTP/dITP diphosphatase [bacterium]|nr:XTP/dITP diphosphatase [bacterium]
MVEIVLATRNKDKVKEIKEILNLKGIKFLSLDDFPDAPEVIEDGETLEENAIKKAETASGFTGKISLADDSGLEVEALNGAPGVRSSRFAGENCTYNDNNQKLLKFMKETPDDKRKAEFRCVAAISKPGMETKTVEGKLKGIIAKELRGNTGFGYDPVFIIPEYGKTIAELGLEIKNKISHRARALSKAKKLLEAIS